MLWTFNWFSCLIHGDFPHAVVTMLFDLVIADATKGPVIISVRGRGGGERCWRRKCFLCKFPEPNLTLLLMFFGYPFDRSRFDSKSPFKHNTKVWHIKISLFLSKTPPPSHPFDLSRPLMFYKKNWRPTIFSSTPTLQLKQWLVTRFNWPPK